MQKISVLFYQAQHAEANGADSLLCLPELYNKPTTNDQLINYLRTVGQAAPNTPLLLYHIPSFTHVNRTYFYFAFPAGITT